MEVSLTKREADNYKGGGFESMLARFNHLIQVSGLFRELKQREFYEKPSTKRCRKLHEARLRQLRKGRKDAVYTKGTKRHSRLPNKKFSRDYSE